MANTVSNKSNNHHGDQYKIKLLTNECVKVHFMPGSYVSLDMAKEQLSRINDMGSNGKVFVIMDLTEIQGIDKEARQYLASDEAGRIFEAQAYVTRSTSSKIIGNFIMNFNKPACPVKLFNSEEKAVEWFDEFNLEND